MQLWPRQQNDYLAGCQQEFGTLGIFLRDATEKALKLTDPTNMKMLMMTAKFASEGAEKRSKILNEKQAELAKHMGKKRRQGD